MRTSRAVWATGATAVLAGAAGSAAIAGAGGRAPAAPVVVEAPPRLSASPVARLAFRADARRFQCRLDDVATAPCTSPVEYRVHEGSHRFTVVAIDGRGRRSRPAYRAWVVDTGAPEAPQFVEAPPAMTRSTQARFVVQGSRLRCALDGVPVPCGRTLEVVEGAHRFSATAADAAGNRSVEAVHEWRADTTPPEAPVLADGGPPFAFSGEAGATFLCALDSGPALPCASPHDYPGPLTGGQHTLTVQARDAAGNVGPATSTRWDVDPQPYRSAVLADDPAGYWRLGESEWGAATAVVGSPGAYTGGVTLAVEGALPGDPDPAAEFDGTSGEVLLAGPTLRASGTLSGWFRFSGIVALRDNTAGNGWILGLNSGGRLACRGGSGNRQALSTVPIAMLMDGWHHLAVTKAAGVVTCYLDGQPVASIDRVPDVEAVAPWHVMNNGTVSEQYSRGQADEIAIYEHALSAPEIAAQFRGGRPS